MRTDALARALKDFGAPAPRAAEPFVMAPAPETMLFDPPAAFTDLPPPEPEPDPQERIDAAVAEAEAALTARLEEEHAAALQAERERHAEELLQQQRQFAEEAAARIEASFGEMEARVVELTGAVTARILGAVLTDTVRERSIDRLATIISEALSDAEAVRIRIRGSLVLYEEVKARLPAYAGQLDFAESPNFDLSVTIEDSVFETRLAEWSTAIAEALS